MINPTTVFDLAGEWDAYPQDNIDDLGSHSTTFGVNNIEENSFSFFPNPVKSNQVFFKSTSVIKVEIYAITGELVISTVLEKHSKSLDISALNSGLYIVKMSNDFGVQVKKLIRQ